MKPIHWFSLSALIVALALLFTGFPMAGWVLLAISTAAELLHSALTGKQANDGMH